MSKFTNIITSKGISFNVRLVEAGDLYGLGMGRMHNRKSIKSGRVEPMIEFYDSRCDTSAVCDRVREEAAEAGIERLGQYAASYFVASLMENIATTRCLKLQLHVEAWTIDGDALRQAFINLGLWSPPAKPKIVIVWDSNDPDTEPQVWVPPSLADQFESITLDKSQEHGGRFPNTDPADITLLEAGTNVAFPDYRQLS